MNFTKYIPCDILKPYIKYYACVENSLEQTYQIFPDTSIVIGFQYKGNLSYFIDEKENKLSNYGITGIQNSYRLFKSYNNTSSILIYFTETGLYNFLDIPLNDLFSKSISLEYLFDRSDLENIEDKLSVLKTDKERIFFIEQFFINQFKDKNEDKLIKYAVECINYEKGKERISELAKKLNISQSPLEKRFRKIVGASPKKYSSIVRFRSIIDNLNKSSNLTELSYLNQYFDQSHFIKDFKRFTNQLPHEFKK